MATIFQKALPVSGENCLILNQGEALIYPFSVGSWTELRIGAFFSFTTASSDNATWSDETSNYTASKNGFFWGIKDSGISLPISSGASFIGLGINTSFAGATHVVTASQYVDGAAPGSNFYQLFSTGTVVTGQTIGGTRLYLASATQQTGTTAFASYNGIKIQITGLGTAGQSVRLSSSVDSLYTNDTSEVNLRQKLSAFAGSATSTFAYFTSGFVGGSGPLTLPSSLFLYSPFFNNRVRVHSLVVEKYA